MSDFKRENTVVYLKPPAFTRRLANPMAMRLNAHGGATLTVAGRRTGEPRKVPLIPVEVGGSRYLVSPYGESEWVRNLRAAGKGELSRKGRTEAFRPVEVPVDQRGPIIARYREVTGRVMGPCFTKLPDVRDHPVFQVDSSSPGR
jgi:deazaflavin-dependent oxidoreductase (nitroreductase family)